MFLFLSFAFSFSFVQYILGVWSSWGFGVLGCMEFPGILSSWVFAIFAHLEFCGFRNIEGFSFFLGFRGVLFCFSRINSDTDLFHVY